jgi:hypothetical protein
MKTINIISAFVLAILAVSTVSALAVGSPYWKNIPSTDDNPLYLTPGASAIVQFTLQNMVGQDDVTLRAQITKGIDMAVIADSSNNYLVPFGDNNVPVNIKVTAPITAKPGDKYNVSVSFTSVTKAKAGQFMLGSAIEKSFDVVIPATTAQAAQPANTLWIWLVTAIVVIAALILLVRRRRKKN